MTKVFDAEATGNWTVTFQTPMGATTTIDLSNALEIFSVNMPEYAGGHAIAAFWTEAAARDCIKMLLEDPVNMAFRNKKEPYCFTVKRIPLESLDQLVRVLSKEQGNNKYAGSYMDRGLGEYDLIASPGGMLYRIPYRSKHPLGWTRIKCQELTYGGRLISLLWSLPILREPQKESVSDG